MIQTTEQMRNGVDADAVLATIDAIRADPGLATFRFRARNEWVGGAHSRATIRDFYGAGQEDISRGRTFTIDAGEPAVLAGSDTGPTSAELLLSALAACLTTALVYVAAARGIRLTSVISTLEGDCDVRALLGIDDGLRAGFTHVRVRFEIQGDAPPERLRQLVELAQARSAVLDMVTNGVPVTVEALVEGEG